MKSGFARRDLRSRKYNFVNQQISNPNFLKSRNAVFMVAPLFCKSEREDTERKDRRYGGVMTVIVVVSIYYISRGKNSGNFGQF